MVNVVDDPRGPLDAILGADNVTDDPLALGAYERDESFAPQMKPRVVVRPGSAEEVQRVVVWANETGTPLVPVSSGPPHFHGDTVPSVPGTVIVELTRLDRIQRVDRRNRICVIDPGVTYAELQPALAEHGMRVTPPLAPRANKSVAASLLERQPTLIPRYNFHLPEPLRDCGVVWGNGDIMYTGEAGGGPLSLEKQWRSGVVQAEHKGPAQTDFYRFLTGAQGTMGIVTWASVKCELLPAARESVVVSAPRLVDVVPFLYELNRVRLGDEVLVLSGAFLARLLAASGERCADLPEWSVLIGLGGRRYLAEERVRVQKADLELLAAQHGLAPAGAAGGVDAGRITDVVSGCCATPWKLAAGGGTSDIFFLTTLDKAGAYIQTVREIAASIGVDAAGLGAYLQPQHQGVSWHVELTLAHDPTDRAETACARAFHDLASERLINDGAYFSRPYGSWARPVYNRDAASTDALRKVKAIFDPAGVMNPGKLCFGAPIVREVAH
jgi:FAD/FMN-containing dehydrogenase